MQDPQRCFLISWLQALLFAGEVIFNKEDPVFALEEPIPIFHRHPNGFRMPGVEELALADTGKILARCGEDSDRLANLLELLLEVSPSPSL